MDQTSGSSLNSAPVPTEPCDAVASGGHLVPIERKCVPPKGEKPKKSATVDPSCLEVAQVHGMRMFVVQVNVLTCISRDFRSVRLHFRCKASDSISLTLDRSLAYIGKRWKPQKAILRGPLSEYLTSMVLRNATFFNNLTTLEIDCLEPVSASRLPKSSALWLPELLRLKLTLRKNEKPRRIMRVIAPKLQMASITTVDGDSEYGSIELVSCLLLTEFELSVNAMVFRQLLLYDYPSVRILTVRQATNAELDWNMILSHTPNLIVLNAERASLDLLQAVRQHCPSLRMLNIDSMWSCSNAKESGVKMARLRHLAIVRSTLKAVISMNLWRVSSVVMNCPRTQQQPIELIVPQLRSFTHILSETPAVLLLQKAKILELITVKFDNYGVVPDMYQDGAFPTVRKLYVYICGTNLNIEKIVGSVPNASTLYLDSNVRRIRWQPGLDNIVERLCHLESLVIRHRKPNKMTYQTFQQLLSVANLKHFMLTNTKVVKCPQHIVIPAQLLNVRLEHVTFESTVTHLSFTLDDKHEATFANGSTVITIEQEPPRYKVAKLFGPRPEDGSLID